MEKPTRYSYQYLLRMPMTEAVTLEEGGDWLRFSEARNNPDVFPSVHAIRFVGGHEWDCVNGWRNNGVSSTAGKGQTCALSELRDAPKSYKRIDTDAAHVETEPFMDVVDAVKFLESLGYTVSKARL